jgi:hypothetical protein
VGAEKKNNVSVGSERSSLVRCSESARPRLVPATLVIWVKLIFQMISLSHKGS